MITIGIDPSKSCTALAALDAKGKIVDTYAVEPPRGLSLPLAIDHIEADLTLHIANTKAIAPFRNTVQYVIEDPWLAFIGGVRGRGAREKTGVCIAHALYLVLKPSVLIGVRTWKGYYKLSGTRERQAAQACAQASFLWDGRHFNTQDEVDAALIANYYQKVGS